MVIFNDSKIKSFKIKLISSKSDIYKQLILTLLANTSTMSLKRILLLTSIMVMTVACNKEPINNDGDQALTTYMSVVVDLSQGTKELTRSEDNTVHNPAGHWEGRDKINGVDIYVVDATTGKVYSKSVELTNTPDANTDGKYVSPAWKAEPKVSVDIYVVLNNGGEIRTKLNNAAALGKAAFEEAYKKAYTYTMSDYAVMGTSNDVILMSAMPLKGQEIKDGVTQAQATISGAPNATYNQFALSARRSAARVSVTKSVAVGTVANIVSGTITYGTLTNFKWTYGQYERKTHLLWDTSATVTPASSLLHYTTKSPSWSYVTNGDYATQAALNYDYTQVNDVASLKVINELPGSGNVVTNIVTHGNMQFLTETTHQYGAAGVTGYRKGNTPYVMVEAVFVPHADLWATPAEQAAHTAGSTKDVFYNTYNGKFYASDENAKADGVAPTLPPGGDGVIKYAGGKVYYFAWINPDNVSFAEVLNSPVLRNNIYNININSFGKIGFSGNPYNPTPGNPLPVDKDDIVPSPDELLSAKETYMSTEITVINWGVHSYNVDF